MIRHSVIFTLTCLKNSAEEKAFLAAAATLSNIPGVLNFEMLKQTSKKNSFDFGFSMEFESQQSYDAYSSHPGHQQFIQQYWVKYVQDFLEIDYEPLQ
ncbi:Dabb family protein [Ferruginibacter paludis]|uniref:Dabb family protein n=1 Tax=Ferruginibacter paludis TaxID=1310417 RepID=UPI0025B418AE|nr:Dabb family protein [Ferruginibacter paludis]MDN3657934.1 Dabb family protein [Ferruginibacter paludis]